MRFHSRDVQRIHYVLIDGRTCLKGNHLRGTVSVPNSSTEDAKLHFRKRHLKTQGKHEGEAGEDFVI